MSSTLERPVHAWQTRPGWGIAVDLTPREVLQGRQVRVHQRLVGLAVLLVLIACVGVAMLSLAARQSATDDYDREFSRTATLAAEAEQYGPITTMETVTAQVQDSLGVVMAQDVDMVNLLALIREARPDGLTVTTQSVLLAPPVAEAAPAPAAPGDASGSAGADGTAPAEPTPDPATAAPAEIGTVTISGEGPDISFINPFVTKLNRIRGVIDVVPTSVVQAESGMSYTISLDITDELYTDRFAPDGVS